MKTIEEKAKTYAAEAFRSATIGEPTWSEVERSYADAYLAGAKDALAGQWKSVKEELPEEGQEVLLYDASSLRHYVVGWRRKKGDNESQWALTNGYVEDKYVTHWLPIPMLPKIRR